MRARENSILREKRLRTYHADGIRKSLAVLKEMNRKQRTRNEAFLRRHDEEISKLEKDRSLERENLRVRKTKYADLVSSLIPKYYKQCEISKIEALRKTRERYEMIRRRRLVARDILERERELSSALARGRHELRMEEAREISETLERTARRERMERNTKVVTNAIDRAALDTTRVMLGRVLAEEERVDVVDETKKRNETEDRAVPKKRMVTKTKKSETEDRPMTENSEREDERGDLLTDEDKDKTIQDPVVSTSPTFAERRGMRRIEKATRIRDDAVIIAHEKARRTGRIRASLDDEEEDKDNGDDNRSETSTTPPTSPPLSPSHLSDVEIAPPTTTEVQTEESTTPPASPPDGDSFTTEDDENSPPPSPLGRSTRTRRFDEEEDDEEFGRVDIEEALQATLTSNSSPDKKKDGNVSSSSEGSFTW